MFKLRVAATVLVAAVGLALVAVPAGAAGTSRWRLVYQSAGIGEVSGVAAVSPHDAWAAETLFKGRHIIDTPYVLHWNGSRWRQWGTQGTALAEGMPLVVPDGHGGVWFAFSHWTGRSWVDTSATAPSGMEMYRMVKVPGTAGSYWAAAIVYHAPTASPALAVYGPLP